MAGRFTGSVRKGTALVVLAFAASSVQSLASDNADASAKETSAVSRGLRNPRAKATFDAIVSASSGMAGDLFPAFANHLSGETPSQRDFAVVQVRVSNPASAEQILRARVSVRIAGWSEEEFQNVELQPGTAKALNFAPPLSDRAFHNREVAPALAQVRVIDSAGNLIYADSVPLRVRASDDMYWGPNFSNASMIASWVTPHDSAVERVLARAKELMPGRRLPGYEPWKSSEEQEQSTREQARAIYRVLQTHGVSYVKSSTTFGGKANVGVSQRIRTPHESLSTGAANCIDGAVMFASLFENLGMDPEVVIVPGHAYVGVRVSDNSARYLLIDTALVARVPFERAVAIAEKNITQWKPNDITRVQVSDARQQGIFPMPLQQ